MENKNPTEWYNMIVENPYKPIKISCVSQSDPDKKFDSNLIAYYHKSHGNIDLEIGTELYAAIEQPCISDLSKFMLIRKIFEKNNFWIDAQSSPNYHGARLAPYLVIGVDLNEFSKVYDCACEYFDSINSEKFRKWEDDQYEFISKSLEDFLSKME